MPVPSPKRQPRFSSTATCCSGWDLAKLSSSRRALRKSSSRVTTPKLSEQARCVSCIFSSRRQLTQSEIPNSRLTDATPARSPTEVPDRLGLLCRRLLHLATATQRRSIVGGHYRRLPAVLRLHNVAGISATARCVTSPLVRASVKRSTLGTRMPGTASVQRTSLPWSPGSGNVATPSFASLAMTRLPPDLEWTASRTGTSFAPSGIALCRPGAALRFKRWATASKQSDGQVAGPQRVDRRL